MRQQEAVHSDSAFPMSHPLDHRVSVPPWKMTHRNCPVCDSTDDRAFAEANINLQTLGAFAFASRKLPEYMHWRLVSCPRCDLLYANPVPSPEELAALYRTAAFDSDAEALLASQIYGRFLPAIKAHLPDCVGALDIGTGNGAFLQELLAAGFSDVVGIEPSTAPIASAAEHVRPLIRHGIFRPDSFPPASLSLITCFQTMEHLSDPLGMCRDAWRILKPGGALFLVGHNRWALSARLLGRKSPIFDIEHLQLFSPASMRHILVAGGFSTVRVQHVFNCYPLSYWTRLFPFPGPIKQALLRALKTSRLGRLRLALPAGNLAAIAFK